MPENRHAPRNFLAILALVLALALTLALAGCGGDDDAGSNGDDGSGAAVPTESGDGGGDDDGGDGGNGGDISSLAGQWQDVTAKITYEVTTTFQGADSTATMAFYHRGEDARYDIETQGAVSSILNVGDKTYSCIEAQGNGQCFEMDNTSGGAATLPFFGDFVDPAIIDSVVPESGLSTSSESIAGEDASCFATDGTFAAGSGNAKWCFSSDGILLLFAFEGGDSKAEYRATEVQRDLSDEDFEPPYDVVQVGG